MITEYGCVQCQKWHRKGMDVEYDQHIVFQSKHGVRERMPLPGEMNMNMPTDAEFTKAKAMIDAEYAQKQLAYAMSHTTNQSVATLEAMNRAAGALERVLEALRSAK